MKKIISFLILILTVSSCGSLGEAKRVFKNEKTVSTDEFLVKKKDPLVLPPDFNELPKPDSVSKTQETEEEKIKTFFNTSEKNKKNKKTSSIEESILSEIQK